MGKNIDIESCRLTPAEKLRLWFNDLLGSFSHRGWKETDAQVEACGAMDVLAGVYMSIGGYAVVLSYEVDGKRYEAEAVSSVKVEKGGTIKIRYNPRHPEQNNSIGSETNWTSPAFRIGTILMVLVLLGLLAAGIVMRR
ncbi:MAG: DUF3592 domain-containing protein [Terracidiphilus sp.]